MYPHLKLAKNLLRQDGVIFMSIDDHELDSISKLGDEIFGMKNRLGFVTVDSNLKGRSDDKYFVREYGCEGET